jgi:hypothetical protein
MNNKLFVFLFVLLSCTRNNSKTEDDLQKNRQIPLQNQALIERVNTNYASLTLQKIKEIEQKEAHPKIEPKNQPAEAVKEDDFPIIKPSKKEPEARQEKEILEIYGGQNKLKRTPPKLVRENKFIISTSYSYNGEGLEDAKNILQNFGTIKLEKEGDMFAIKVYSKEGLQTKEEANAFLKQIIKASFFDVFVEELNPQAM